MSNLSAMLQLFDQGKQAGFFSEARKRVLDNFFQTDHGHARLFYRNLLSALSSFFFSFFFQIKGVVRTLKHLRIGFAILRV